MNDLKYDLYLFGRWFRQFNKSQVRYFCLKLRRLKGKEQEDFSLKTLIRYQKQIGLIKNLE